MPLLNSANLTTLYVSFKTTFENAFQAATPTYPQIATLVPSDTQTEEYGWLGQIPQVREWLGDRVIHAMAAHGYAIRNRDWELTVSVDRNDLDDDRLGIYSPLFGMLGQQAALHPERLVYQLLKAGFSTPCFDGANYFDTVHPVLDETGTAYPVSNTQAGTSTPWYLLCTTGGLKPLIYQERQPFLFRRMDAPTDEVVFERKQYRYGVDGRSNVGFGFWQFAAASQQPLTADNYAALRAGMMSLKGDYGQPLNLVPDLLVAPPALEGAARKLLISDRDNMGATNEWAGSAKPLIVPLLA
jgi:phage major head subunit gpT-like protein